jgi:hypothetical protein
MERSGWRDLDRESWMERVDMDGERSMERGGWGEMD